MAITVLLLFPASRRPSWWPRDPDQHHRHLLRDVQRGQHAQCGKPAGIALPWACWWTTRSWCSKISTATARWARRPFTAHHGTRGLGRGVALLPSPRRFPPHRLPAGRGSTSSSKTSPSRSSPPLFSDGRRSRSFRCSSRCTASPTAPPRQRKNGPASGPPGRAMVAATCCSSAALHDPVTRLVVAAVLVSARRAPLWMLARKMEVPPEGNRDLIINVLIPPPGLSFEERNAIGEQLYEPSRPTARPRRGLSQDPAHVLRRPRPKHDPASQDQRARASSCPLPKHRQQRARRLRHQQPVQHLPVRPRPGRTITVDIMATTSTPWWRWAAR